MVEKRTNRIKVSLSDSELADMRDAASKLNCSMSQVVRNIVSNHVNKEQNDIAQAIMDSQQRTENMLMAMAKGYDFATKNILSKMHLICEMKNNELKTEIDEMMPYLHEATRIINASEAAKAKKQQAAKARSDKAESIVNRH